MLKMSGTEDAVALLCESLTLDKELGQFPIRVSIVDFNLRPLLDTFVTVTDRVVSFNTDVHGISEATLLEKGSILFHPFVFTALFQMVPEYIPISRHSFR